MIKLRLFACLLFVWSDLALANKPCEVSGKNLEELMNQNYKAFDETEPRGGWRDLYSRECYLEAGKLIDVYQIHNLKKLRDDEKRMLTWHAGQNFANEGLNYLALSHFKQCLDPGEKPDSKTQWNAYVTGTIAFLERDLPKLKSTRNELLKVKPAPWSLEILGNLIECFDFPYREIGGKCKPKGLKQ